MAHAGQHARLSFEDALRVLHREHQQRRLQIGAHNLRCLVQRLNAAEPAKAGAALIIADDELTGATILDRIVPLVKNRAALAEMTAAAGGSATQNADELLARIVLAVADHRQSRAGRRARRGPRKERTR